MARIRMESDGSVEIADDALGAAELVEIAKKWQVESAGEQRLGAASSLGFERREGFGFRRRWGGNFRQPHAARLDAFEGEGHPDGGPQWQINSSGDRTTEE